MTGRSFAASLLCALTSACGPETLVIATRDHDASTRRPVDAGDADSDGGSALDDAAFYCSDDVPCAADALCEKATCDAPFGTCESRPTVCSAEELPVCGCDGVSYFNDCLRRANGVPSSTQGECGRGAHACGPPGGGDCPKDAYCARIDSGSRTCDPGSSFTSGKCWILPAVCAAAQGSGDRFVSCAEATYDPTQPPTERSCVSACEAIRSEEPQVRVLRCIDTTHGHPGQMFAP